MEIKFYINGNIFIAMPGIQGYILGVRVESDG